MERFEKLITEYFIPNIQAEVLVYIYMLSYKMDAKTEEIAKRYGITRAQYNILNILNQQYPEPATMSILKERTVVIKSDISRIVMRLRKIGLINYIVNKKDRRSVSISINEKGRELFVQINANKDELLRPFLALPDGEIETMKLLLRKLLIELEN